MQTRIEQLRQEIDEGQPYWTQPNLAKAYTEQKILPLLADALDDLLPIVMSRHSLNPVSSSDQVNCVHYTTIGALMQMLQHHKRTQFSTLRLYDSLHVNDPDEGYYLPRQFISDSRYEWMGLRGKDLLLGDTEQTRIENAYITSFVLGNNVEDNLVFWRTYGREGRGCSMVCSIRTTCLQQVLYGEKSARKTIDDIRPVLDCLNPIVEQTDQAIHRILAEKVWSSLKGIVYLYKSSAYEYEKECRYVLLESDVDKDEIHFEYQDSSGGMPRIRHYVERDALSIDKILPSGSHLTIGPCVPLAENVRKHLSTIASRSGMTGRPEIRISKISYRLP